MTAPVNFNSTNNMSYFVHSNLSKSVQWLSAAVAAAAAAPAPATPTLVAPSFILNNTYSAGLLYSTAATHNDYDESTSTDTDTESHDLIHNKFVQIFFCLIYATVFVLGVFGNVLVCYVVLRNRAMQTVTNIFITNLALSDILLCVLAVPFTPLYTFMGRWAFGRTLCHLVSFAQGCSIYISTLTLTSIAVDRYFVIIYPFHPRMRLSTCIVVIVCIWAISLLATLPYGMYMKVVSDVLLEEADNGTARTHERHVWNGTASARRSLSYSVEPSTASYVQLMSDLRSSVEIEAAPSTAYCEENWPSEHYRKIFGSLTTILQFVLPFVIISICYTWVSMKLNARARAKPGSKSSRREEADRDRKKRTNRMLISMVAVFGLSWLPLNLVNIFDDFYEKSNEWCFYTLLFFVAHSIAMSSTCYNPFLYAWLNENFRKEFKHVLPCFDPSNNNIMGISGRGYNRSERNTCGPRLRNGAGGTAAELGGTCTDLDELDENGLTQQTAVAKDKRLIVPREATYGNGNGSSGGVGVGGGAGGCNLSGAAACGIGILLNDAELGRGEGRREEFDSADEENTVEMRFVETPFVSSDNATGISIMMETSTSNEAQDKGRGTN